MEIKKEQHVALLLLHKATHARAGALRCVGTENPLRDTQREKPP